MAFDYGARTVGVAVSEPLLFTASPVETVRREKENHLRKTFARLEELIRQYEVTHLVVGLPLNMDGTEGERAEKARAFGEALARRTGLPVTWQDERLSSVAGEEMLADMGFDARGQKRLSDMAAAVIILEDALAALRKGN